MARRGIISPLDLGSAVKGWWRADQLSADGATWTDLSGVGNHGVQATVGARATKNAADATFGGRASLSFAGAQFYDVALAEAISAPATVVFVGSCSGLAGYPWCDAAAGGRMAVQTVLGGSVRLYQSVVFDVPNSPTNGPFICAAGINGGSSFVRVNGRMGGVRGDCGTAAATTAFRIGHDNAPMYLTGKLAEMFLIAGVPSDANLVNLERYLRWYYWQGRQNLFPWASDLTNAAWSKGAGMTVVAAPGITTPDGSAAVRATWTAGGTTQYVVGSVGLGAGTHTISAWARAVSGTAKMRQRLPKNARDLTHQFGPDVTLTTDWQRVSFTADIAGSYGAWGVLPLAFASDASAGDIYISEPQLVQANWPGDYLATYAAPMPMGIQSKVGETQNAFPYSEAFNSWAKQNVTINENTLATQDPFGGNAACEMVETGATNIHMVNANDITQVVGCQNLITATIWAKAKDRQWLCIFTNGTQNRAWYDLVNGVLGSTSGSKVVSRTIVAVPGRPGWYKLTLKYWSTIAGTTLFMLADADGSSSYTGTLGLVGAYIFGAQSCAGDSPYVRTSGTAITAGIRSQATARVAIGEAHNLLIRSNEFASASWTRNKILPTDNAAEAFDGSMTACQLRETAFADYHALTNVSVLLQSAGVYTAAMDVKDDGRSLVTLDLNTAGVPRVGYNLTTGALPFTRLVQNAGIIDLGNGWKRIWFTAAIRTSGGPTELRIFLATALTSDPNPNSYMGDPTKGVLVSRASCLYGANPTLYTPTVAARVTTSIRSRCDI